MRPFFLAITVSLVATASQAAEGCGPGFHVNRRGICRADVERVVVAEPRAVVVERPVVVARPAVVVRRPECGIRVGPIAVRGAC